MNSLYKRNQELLDLIGRIQQYISRTNSKALGDVKKNEALIKKDIRKYIEDHRVLIDGYTSIELLNRIFSEMGEYGILTAYLENENKELEEININSYDSVVLHYKNGDVVRAPETFLSAESAKNIMIRLLFQQSEKTLSAATPKVTGFLKNNIRITATCPPLADEECGVQASIRFVNPSKLRRDDLIRKETLTDEMFDFINLCVSSGLSAVVAGSTSSGKTTFLDGLLGDVEKRKRIITIEEEVRELNLVTRDENGIIDNNVVHWKTHGSINSRELLNTALTCDPDIIVPQEMKGEEAYTAQEAARTGHAVLTTTHANSCRAAYTRMLTLCMLDSTLEDKVLYRLVCEAFTIAIFCKRLDDYSRKVMEITECIVDEHGDANFRTLYDYEIDSSEKISDTKTIIKGHFVKRNNMSKSLQQWLITNGVPTRTLERFIDESLGEEGKAI
ncbi:ATPase, T2SS/T4P/T4SS family [Acetobacterium wieringae]|jgi:pilus assembly protein CpaF|uniref:Type IV secretion system protein PtlH n=1 Tax=Acetobacterium wieringae TaxID=52694 RepID=A0A1F2PJJ9_9FIRM|nr:ATPase, T2SS/T4P/T4SS family [Acetobacterium wieringae]OFV71503.1 type IV secretion system protein PtlH [Acetobacterium wieringae]